MRDSRRSVPVRSRYERPEQTPGGNYESRGEQRKMRGPGSKLAEARRREIINKIVWRKRLDC